MDPRERAFVIVLSIVVLGATLSPLLRHPDEDSFPLSTYPMFSHARPRELVMVHALGLDDAGARTPLPPMISAANREVLQSMATLQHAVRGGRARAQCEEIAARVAADDGLDHVVGVEIATDTFDVVAYFEEDRTEPLARDVHVSCRVPR
ncbi:hypothetical protein [Sandaracinus amylolyticus]|uniref:hypothetical protein n=1 Tax=Sandaracinus amylolyticus TaxID=927083 RepID=UPI001F291717|nr:hypothetical protein [Sandaracinus amylolyticus]UJR85668.1 Hypothetical protein I5071_77480 [Sandaracinus amylolyticus]